MKERTKILATVDGKLRTVSESSIRRNLKLNDEEGISSLPDAELFENLQLMGYNILPNKKFTFQKGQFSHQWKYLIHTIMQCLSPKSTGFNEFSSNIATVLAHDALLEVFLSKPQDHCSTEVHEGSGNTNPTASASNPPADHIKTLTAESPIPTFEDILGGTTNSDESNGDEADISNMETVITASPTPTLRIHKDHPKSQIIGPVDNPIQTKNKSKEISDALQDLSWVEAMQEELLQFKI
nr:ribonuclease H-like domain-containing protein [Tanacetum cinerariifolium]